MTLPRYILRHFVTPGGVRLPKLAEPQDVAGICPTCSKPVLRTKINGAAQLVGHYHRNEFYHYGHAPIQPISEDGRTKKAHKGNLSPEEYRFWIGYPETGSTYAMCRACRASVYSMRERESHFKDENHFIGGEPCSTRLVNAYKRIAHVQICLVCKQSRYTFEKWGVPLCGKPECLRAWQFEQTRWLILEKALSDQRTHSIELARQKLVANQKPIAIITSDGKETTRPYCIDCHMFADNMSHGEIHAARLISGVIIEN